MQVMETHLTKKMVVILDTRLKIIKTINRTKYLRLSLIISITRLHIKRYFGCDLQSPIFVRRQG